MTIPVEISFNGNHLKVNGEGEIGVVNHTHPPLHESLTAYPFSDWFANDAGSNDLRVDGSVASKVFAIDALQDRDIFIKSISLRISDNGARLDRFGALTALTNGVDFKYKTNALGEVLIQDQIKTNLDLVRLGHQTPAIGSGGEAFRADVSGSGADSYLVVIDMEETFGFPWGLRLEKGTNDRLCFIVNDDLSVGIDAFDIKGFGIQL